MGEQSAYFTGGRGQRKNLPVVKVLQCFSKRASTLSFSQLDKFPILGHPTPTSVRFSLDSTRPKPEWALFCSGSPVGPQDDEERWPSVVAATSGQWHGKLGSLKLPASQQLSPQDFYRATVFSHRRRPVFFWYRETSSKPSLASWSVEGQCSSSSHWLLSSISWCLLFFFFSALSFPPNLGSP